eukprot:13469_1
MKQTMVDFKDYEDNENESTQLYESSGLSVSSSASYRVQKYIKDNKIPSSHINKHFTFKSTKKKHRKHHTNTITMLPSASHSLLHLKPNIYHTNYDSDSNTSSTSDDDIQETSRITKHHWWTRLTIQCACFGVSVIEFGWTVFECLIVPYLFISNTPYYCIAWIAFFIPVFDSWLQPLIYVYFHKLIYKRHQYFYAQ